MSNIDMSQMITPEDRAEAQSAAIRDEAIGFLRQTDWYVTRQAETGIAIPEDVAQQRQTARLRAQG